MKYLILFLVVISLPLFAQKHKKIIKVDIKIQMTEWMAKISSDPELREAMIEMILDNTRGNKEEMTKFGKTMMDNQEMNTIISGMLQKEKVPIQFLSMVGDSINIMKLSDYKLNIEK
jgi:hypothetical protein